MALNNIEILRQNGGIPATLPGEDHYSGLLVYLDNTDLPEADEDLLTMKCTFCQKTITYSKRATTTECPSCEKIVTCIQATENKPKKGFSEDEGGKRIIQISTIEYAESLGIRPDPANWIVSALHYHLSEAFRINPAIMLWVGLYDKPGFDTTGNANPYTFEEIKTMQDFAEGKIRQIGVYTPDNDLKSGDVKTLQGIATNLESNDMPLSILYCPKISDIDTLKGSGGDMRDFERKNVSVLIGQEGSDIALDLSMDEFETTNSRKCVGLIGNALGMVSKVAVHESIAWVAKCPSGISTPAFADGKLVKETPKGTLDLLCEKQYIFLRTFGGLQGSFYNDSFTVDNEQSDYKFIERVRTMDKACRGIRTYLLPHLSSPLYVDPQSGKLSQGTVAFLTSVANRQLEAMEKAGELSGYVVEVDPDQIVLSTQEVEFVIKQVPVGVMRKIRIKIGFTTKLG
jgi:predicted RNA-binding Zn-ribbon protein involved in translation (DUF1610 family)